MYMSCDCNDSMKCLQLHEIIVGCQKEIDKMTLVFLRRSFNLMECVTLL